MNRFLENKETDALFALPEKGESEDDVDTLLRTTKRFIGNAKTIPPEHLSIQLLKMFHRSAPCFLCVNGGYLIHIYDVKEGVCSCRKVIHLNEFFVNEVYWTSRNT